MAKKIFINLPVADLKKQWNSIQKPGLSITHFADDTVACMVLTEEIHVMLLTHSKFSGKRIIDAQTDIGVIKSISVESTDEVNSMEDAALNAGGSKPGALKD